MRHTLGAFPVATTPRYNAYEAYNTYVAHIVETLCPGKASVYANSRTKPLGRCTYSNPGVHVKISRKGGTRVSF